MLLLYKIEKQVNQGNIHPQLGRKIKTAIKQKTENKEAKNYLYPAKKQMWELLRFLFKQKLLNFYTFKYLNITNHSTTTT